MSGVPASHWNMADLPDVKELDCEQVGSIHICRLTKLSHLQDTKLIPLSLQWVQSALEE